MPFLKRFPERKKNQSEKPKEIGDATVVMDGYDSIEVLTISEFGLNID